MDDSKAKSTSTKNASEDEFPWEDVVDCLSDFGASDTLKSDDMINSIQFLLFANF
jgi:hypothetical protein